MWVIPVLCRFQNLECISFDKRRHSREVGSGPPAWDTAHEFVPESERRGQQDCNWAWAIVTALPALVVVQHDSGVVVRGSGITVGNFNELYAREKMTFLLYELETLYE